MNSPLRKPYVILLPVLIAFLAAFSVQTHAKQKNVLLILVDDLRPELASFGAEYIHSPNIDRLAEQGRPFHQHFVNAPREKPHR